MIKVSSSDKNLWLSCVVGGLLLVAGVSHLANTYSFLESIVQYSLVSPKLAALTAAFLPWCEVIVAIMLLLRINRFVAFFLASMMMTCFCFAQVSAIARGLNIGCGCFGSLSSEPIGVRSILTVFALLLFSISGLFQESRLARECSLPASMVG